MTDTCGKRMEILAPAGSLDILKKAFAAGADAVYAGGSAFGARAFAHNFTEKEMLEGIDYAHLHDKKLYMTVNTLIKENEFDRLYEYLLPFYKEGLDAVIVQDLGAMDFIREQFPELPIHASTQMTVTNLISASFLEKRGIVRVVPARELSLPEIREISQHTSLEIECFVHGALCYCYSGQCLMSSLIGGRSGNRGQCAQPCRLPWKNGENRESKDLLSMKDLCTIDLIPELIEAGITSFKIEGRMKQGAYVETVTSIYRKYTDLYLQLKENNKTDFRVSKEDKNLLYDAYRRRGYTDGYYKRHNGRQMLSLSRPSSAKEPLSSENSCFHSRIRKKINGKLILSAEKSAKLILDTVSDGKNVCVTTEGEPVQQAQKQPVSSDRLKKQLNKTGDSEFVFNRIEIQAEENIFLPIQAVNALRRQALKNLTSALLQNFSRSMPAKTDFPALSLQPSRRKATEIPLYVSVDSYEQAAAVLANPLIKRMYFRDTMVSEKGFDFLVKQARERKVELYFITASIYRKEAASFYKKYLPVLMDSCSGAMVRNLEVCLLLKEQNFSKPVDTGSSVYQWNRRAQNFFKELGRSYWEIPLELNKRELESLDRNQMLLPIYGYLPVMTSAGCIQKHLKGCTGKAGWLSLTDRYNKRFMVRNECAYCYNILYNPAPLVLADLTEEIEALSPAALLCHFTWENAGHVTNILRRIQDMLSGTKNIPWPGDFTRGHFKRGVK